MKKFCKVIGSIIAIIALVRLVQLVVDYAYSNFEKRYISSDRSE